jgi:hypothetical protein
VLATFCLPSLLSLFLALLWLPLVLPCSVPLPCFGCLKCNKNLNQGSSNADKAVLRGKQHSIEGGAVHTAVHGQLASSWHSVPSCYCPSGSSCWSLLGLQAGKKTRRLVSARI